MLISINWIKDYVKLDALDPKEVMSRITLATAEVEDVFTYGAQFSDIVTARVMEVKPHPNADKLKLARVTDGVSEMEVVCGAPNVAEGQIAALAKVGARLPDIGKLKASKIRGIRSEGMLLAEDEMGLSDDHEGIYLFDETTPIGTPLNRFFGEEDIVLEVDNKSLTHRPDLWGHIGFAREFAAVYEKGFNLQIKEPAPDEYHDEDPLAIENQASDLCPRYSALVVDNVQVVDSPFWLQQRLRNVGIRPINNLVDVTNYVMLEYGQPMHAFDRRQIKGDTIIIRRAEKGEKFTTLDEREHILTEETVVIADAERAVALGGVMGGLNSEIVDDTSCLVLESANFDPVSVRRTAARHQCRTESAMRFEKAQDAENTTPAIFRAVELIRLTCPDAKLTSRLLDDYPAPAKPVSVTIELEHIQDRLGEPLSEERVVKILTSLQFKVKRMAGGYLEVGVPSFRATKDISMKADIIEEVGRIYGYDNIPPKAPLVLSDPPKWNRKRQFEWHLCDIFTLRFAFDEVSNYSFVNAEELAICGFDPEKALRLNNPESSEKDRMRTSLIPNIVKNIRLNQKHFDAFKLFELGRVVHKDDPESSRLADENFRLGAALFDEKEKTPFYSVKGVAEELFELLHIEGVSFERAQSLLPAFLHPGRSVAAVYKSETLGLIGELHPKVAAQFEIKGNVGLLDLDMDKLFKHQGKLESYLPLRKFPTSRIEITALLDERREVADMEAVIEETGGKLLVDYGYLYAYQGEPIEQGKKAVTYFIVYGAEDKTLDTKETKALHASLVDALNKAGMPVPNA